MNLGIEGLAVAVTGGSRGIGRAIAECCAAEGARVSICARTDADLQKAASRLRSAGTPVVAMPCDVSDSDAIGRWLDATVEAFGGIDILISNVSSQSRDWQVSCNIDLLATVSLVEQAVVHLRASEFGSIVFVASKAAGLAVPNYKAYSAMKAALLSYSGSLSRELAPSGIRVNAVSPGEILFPGGIWERIRRERPERYEGAVARIGLGRMGTPEEVALAAVFLASPAASYIAGANLIIDGAGRDYVQF